MSLMKNNMSSLPVDQQSIDAMAGIMRNFSSVELPSDQASKLVEQLGVFMTRLTLADSQSFAASIATYLGNIIEEKSKPDTLVVNTGDELSAQEARDIMQRISMVDEARRTYYDSRRTPTIPSVTLVAQPMTDVDDDDFGVEDSSNKLGDEPDRITALEKTMAKLMQSQMDTLAALNAIHISIQSKS